MKFTRDIIRLAKELMVEVEIIFDRSHEVDGYTYRLVQSEIQKMVDRISKNESIKSFTTRLDTEDRVVIGVGFSEHDSKKAILEEMGKLASKLAKKNNLGKVVVKWID